MELLDRMSRTAGLYEVGVFPRGGIDMDYSLSKQYRTYRGAVAYAVRISRQLKTGRAEIVDLSTDRGLYTEDLAASQEYIKGELYRDGEKIL